MQPLITRTAKDVATIAQAADLEAPARKRWDSRRACWDAIEMGSKIIREIQRIAATHHDWESLDDAKRFVDPNAWRLLQLRKDAIDALKRAPHHAQGFLYSKYVHHQGSKHPRACSSLCLISGSERQEIPGLVAYDRVVVDVEHMGQALGPATVDDIFRIRKLIGEYVLISTNVSETPQIVRNLSNGRVDTRATAALTSLKVLSAIQAGADVVKVGFAHLDPYKHDLTSEEVVKQMLEVRGYVDRAQEENMMVRSLAGKYPLVSVFFPEIGIDYNAERPMDIAAKAIELTAAGGWQGLLIDTFEKNAKPKKAYRDYYSLADTHALAEMAHKHNLELWIAGSITQPEVKDLVACEVDLICFGGAARHASGSRAETGTGNGAPEKEENPIQRALVEDLVRAFEEADPRTDSSTWPGRTAEVVS